MRTTANGRSLAPHWLFFSEEFQDVFRKNDRSHVSFHQFMVFLKVTCEMQAQNKIESNHKGESAKAENESTLNPSYLFRSCERRNCDELKCPTLLLCEL